MTKEIKEFCPICSTEEPYEDVRLYRVYERRSDAGVNRAFVPIGWYCRKCQYYRFDEVNAP